MEILPLGEIVELGEPQVYTPGLEWSMRKLKKKKKSEFFHGTASREKPSTTSEYVNGY